MDFLHLIYYLLAAFATYLIGRWSHYYLNDRLGNPKWAPDHWIYGLLLIIVGLIFHQEFLGLLALSFGAGLFVSDFKDFLKLKFIGPDEEEEKRFWGID